MAALLGPRDELLRQVEDAFVGTAILARGNEITVEGLEAEKVARLFEELRKLLEAGSVLDAAVLGRTIDMVKDGETPSEVLTAEVLKSARGRAVRPKSSGQKRYADAIARNVITFGIGPAGTGKSYLAVALAVQALQGKDVDRIILTRPAVEAGERLGFLPGDLLSKVDPYLRPLYDALYDMLTPEGTAKLMSDGRIEVAPLAYMRGRAQPVDTPVLTPNGFVPIGSLVVGDLVVGSNGRPNPVLGVYPQGVKGVYRVATQDGAATLASADHLWFVTTRDDRRHGKPGRIVTTLDMVGRSTRFDLPLVAPVEFAPRPVRIDPYLVGQQAARDSLSREVPSRRLTRQKAGAATTPTTGGGVGVLDRAIPEEQLLNSASARLAVLQGLLDVGGEPISTGGVRYWCDSDQLADDVVFLVQSLGGIVYRDNAQILDIRLPAGIAPFRLTRKAERYAAVGGGRPMRFIDSIEPVGEAECVCIAVGAADSLYVTSDFLVTHNTLNNSFIILDEAQNTTPEQMKMFLTRIGFGSRAVITGDVTQIDIDHGRSGLIGLEEILQGIDGLAFVRLSHKDVVRHRIVQDIVTAYERAAAEPR